MKGKMSENMYEILLALIVAGSVGGFIFFMHFTDKQKEPETQTSTVQRIEEMQAEIDALWEQLVEVSSNLTSTLEQLNMLVTILNGNQQMEVVRSKMAEPKQPAPDVEKDLTSGPPRE